MYTSMSVQNAVLTLLPVDPEGKKKSFCYSALE